jgi:dUTP pyrophosphatase
MTAPVHIPVEIKILDEALLEFGLPQPATEGAAAADLTALSVFGKTADNKPDTKAPPVPIVDVLRIDPWDTAYVSVGFAMDIMDPGYAAHLIPRSSSSALNMAMANTVGLLDSDYHGPVIIALFNRNLPGGKAIEIRRGERIAQMYLAPVVRADWKPVQEFSRTTGRGASGFGSTGTAENRTTGKQQ